MASLATVAADNREFDMSPEFLVTALIVVLAPGTGVIYTLAVALARGRLASV